MNENIPKSRRNFLKIGPSSFSSRTLHGLLIFTKVGNGIVFELLETVATGLET